MIDDSYDKSVSYINGYHKGKHDGWEEGKKEAYKEMSKIIADLYELLERHAKPQTDWELI